MANWLERAQREVQKSHGLGTANTDERPLTAVMAVQHPGESGISRVSNVSNGSTLVEGFPENEGDILAADLTGLAARESMLPAGANPDPLPSLPAAEPTILAALADPDLPGVSPEFTARLSAETEDLRAFFEERAGILEYDAGLPRPKAELEAARITATLARNRGYL